jgi:hypothetical protein
MVVRTFNVHTSQIYMFPSFIPIYVKSIISYCFNMKVVCMTFECKQHK